MLRNCTGFARGKTGAIVKSHCCKKRKFMGEQKNSRSGFTRTDLLVVLGCACFLGLVWMRPSLAGSAARNDEAVCANNLRHIGRAFQQWWQDHDEHVAWWMPLGNPAATRSYPYHVSIWFQFFWVSNYLSSPRYLADPADDWPNLRVATSWGNQPGGLLTQPYKATAMSYFLGIHATPHQPQSILSGDGNIRAGGIVGCSSGIPSNDVRPQNALW